jgi:hypothetical protein
MPRPVERLSVALTSLCLLLAGCVASVPRPTTPAPCITPKLQGLMIRWGTVEPTGHVRAYEMNTRGEVFDISAPEGMTAQPTYVTHLDQAVYCERVTAINDAFLQTQAMNVRGERARFMEYVNPTTDVYLRVTWNPDLTTFQSRYFRAEFDAIMEHVPAP